MERVRDEAITDWDTIDTGRAKGVTAEQTRELLASFDAEQIEVLRRFIPRIVDTALHHLLWTLDQEEWVDVAVRTDRGVVPSLREVSDGLAGDFHDWVPRFSKQPYEPLR